MILLPSTAAIVTLVTSGTQTIAVRASWVDAAGTSITPSSENTVISTAAMTTLVGSPGENTQRNIKFLSIRNTDLSVTDVVTVYHYDGVTSVPLISVPLQAGYTLFYEDSSGWYVVDSYGGRQGIQGVPGTDGTDGTDGISGTINGAAILDFGAAPGSNTASATVTGQTSLTAAHLIRIHVLEDKMAKPRAFLIGVIDQGLDPFGSLRLVQGPDGLLSLVTGFSAKLKS